MRRLTHDEYAARLARRYPHLRPLDRYCKANLELTVLCERCGSTLTREAAAHLRFDCPHCSRDHLAPHIPAPTATPPR